MIVLAIVGILFSIGILAGAFKSPISCAFGDILLCTRNFIDILIFWQLAMRYWETSSHYRDYIKETSGIIDMTLMSNTNDQEQSVELMATMRQKSVRIQYFRRCYVIVLIISVFGWGIFDAVYGFLYSEQNQEFFEKFRDDETRGEAFEIAKVLWLVLRFVPISMLGVALVQFLLVQRNA